jgi:hypothetical protein
MCVAVGHADEGEIESPRWGKGRGWLAREGSGAALLHLKRPTGFGTRPPPRGRSELIE